MQRRILLDFMNTSSERDQIQLISEYIFKNFLLLFPSFLLKSHINKNSEDMIYSRVSQIRNHFMSVRSKSVSYRMR